MAKTIKMNKKELVNEHENLIKVLKNKNPKNNMKEAEKQEKELKEYKSKKHEKKESSKKEKSEFHEDGFDHDMQSGYDTYKRKG